MAELNATVYQSIKEINRNQWNNVVEQSELGSVFHRYGWLLAVERGLGYDSRHVVVSKKSNPVAVFPNFITSLDLPSVPPLVSRVGSEVFPQSLVTTVSSVADDFRKALLLHQLVSARPGFGGPVVTSNEEECLELLFDRLGALERPSVLIHAIEAKEPDFMRYSKKLTKRGYRPTLLTCRFQVSLNKDFDALIAEMDKERRKALRDGRSQQYSVRELTLEENTLSTTYEQYTTDMNRVDGHVYPRAFFDALAVELTPRMKVFAVEVDETEAGRYVYVLDDEQSSVHHFFSAIGDDSYFEYNPSELLHAHVMQWGQNNGYEYYDFGNTPADFRNGSFAFKEKFGGQMLPTIRWEKGASRLLWPAYRFARRTYQRRQY